MNRFILFSAPYVNKKIPKTKWVSTGNDIGGLVFIYYSVDDVVRIRTGEQGQDALMYAGDIDERRGRK